jgi:ATP-dependent Lon protease
MVPQRDANLSDPGEDDLYRVGTASVIMRMLKLPDGRIRILVQGIKHVRIEHLSQTEPFLLAKVEDLPAPKSEAAGLKSLALLRSVKEGLERVVQLGRGISSEVMVIAANLEEPGRLADLVASNLELKVEEAQDVLETVSPVERLRKVNDLLMREIELLTMQEEISAQARGEIDRSQREYYLRQQLKTIQMELGESEELAEEISGYRSLAAEKGMSEEALRELDRQVLRLERGHPDSAETMIARTYLETLTGLPWKLHTQDRIDLEHARRVLDSDHYDLDHVKQRIIEFLAVRQLNPRTKGPILCFVGPPGVGKTSLGRSIARALGRDFTRASLGGVHDEAEIRGHRRTYVGAMPGRVVQGIQQAGTSNPVFMLDEIDKLGSDFRGDPSSALLEVLDPEQNSGFRDHYLGVDYDLSQVMFITTANLTESIQPAFLDRMEVIRLSGYTSEEKLQIARRHLIPRQVAENGLTAGNIAFTPAGVKRVISGYTRESGLRNLERELAAICRKVAVEVALGRTARISVTARRVEELLGPPRELREDLLQTDRVGVATGLAWTAAGGDLLFIEAVGVPGDGKLVLTGQLGEVMKESAQAALSYARAADPTGERRDLLARTDIHVHVPAGSIPKDGPSAGITIATAIVSLVADRPVDRRLAMTGEITLRGDVLAIGGLKEKVLAAREAGIRTILVPRRNERDYAQLAETLTRGLTVHFVGHMDEVLRHALHRPPSRRRRGASPRRRDAADA